MRKRTIFLAISICFSRGILLQFRTLIQHFKYIWKDYFKFGTNWREFALDNPSGGKQPLNDFFQIVDKPILGNNTNEAFLQIFR